MSSSATVHAYTNIDGEELPFHLTAVDRHILSITDDQYQPHTWEELKDIIANNKLETLKRWPSDLRRYIKWSAATKKEYGSIMAFVMRNRLQWTPSPTSTPDTGPIFDFEDPQPFANPHDYSILPNDWPYGLDRGISHLIVWLKNRLEVEPTRGDLTAKSRAQVETFVQQHFVAPVTQATQGSDNVLWFKNWVSLQSVPGIDHVHVLLKGVPQDLIDRNWTNGRRPLQEQVKI